MACLKINNLILVYSKNIYHFKKVVVLLYFGIDVRKILNKFKSVNVRVKIIFESKFACMSK